MVGADRRTTPRCAQFNRGPENSAGTQDSPASHARPKSVSRDMIGTNSNVYNHRQRQIDRQKDGRWKDETFV
ncbi:hypothetical protein V1478_011591 [Vespula squamosa]|uniref:Uncharacterized protein n=1 Tax=Vespula squamosa TaxID=30214 RepID=A0ABD2AEX4_VESSQ